MNDKEVLQEALRRVISRKRSNTLRELSEVAQLKGKDFRISDLILNDKTLSELYTKIYDDDGVQDLETTVRNSLDSNDDYFKRKVLEKLEIDPNLLSEDEY